MRRTGVLLPVSSLPSSYGIGAFSQEAYEFVDFLAAAGQTYWQILPLGPTGYGDSPYQAFSTFAGNPYFVDLTELIQNGWLTKKECDDAMSDTGSGYVHYEALFKSRFKLLHKAYLHSKIANDQEFIEFQQKNEAWLSDYSLFMAIKDAMGGKSFLEWPTDIRMRKPAALRKYKATYANECRFYAFIQYFFRKQWSALKTYANSKKIRIIGDIPIYVALDSADTWAHPELFQLDKKGNPTAVAGCPPDYFSATGQLWGNPLYRWDYHTKTNYAWWMERLSHCFTLYDVVRIDHFRGFDEYYSIPFKDPTAEYGHWEQGPGMDFFHVMRDTLGDKPVIAEDLGFLTKSVLKLVQDTGFPGMKVLEFAFDSDEDNDYLPHNFDKNCIVYTGTHDNDTVIGWYETLKKKDRRWLRNYLHVRTGNNIAWDLIRLGSASVADTLIVPMQDYLELGSEARINTPSTLGMNWEWRMKKGQCTLELAEKMRRLAQLYGRLQ